MTAGEFNEAVEKTQILISRKRRGEICISYFYSLINQFGG